MNANEIIAKLRDKFNELMQPVAPVEPAKPKTAKLMDGTEVEISEYAPGGVVTIAGAPAPAGDHTLEDGTTITLAEGGVITEIEAPEAAPATPVTPDQMRAFIQKFAVGTPEERLANIEAMLKPMFESTFGWELREAEMKAGKDAAMTAYQTLKTQFDEQKQQLEAISKTSDSYKALFSEMFNVVEAIAKAPVAQPDAAVQTEFKNQEKPDYSKLASQFITKK